LLRPVFLIILNKYTGGIACTIKTGSWLYSQAAVGKIFGNVKDAAGKYLSGVTVTATHIETNAASTTVTENKGTFRFLALDPGLYQISFDLEGYQSLVQAGIHLYTDQSVRLRIKLKKKE
jgi:hypothetical protein